MNLKGKMYLPVNARIQAFREECSIFEGWGISTQQIAGSLQEQFATFRAEISDPNGKVVSVGTKTEDIKGFPDFAEKAETGAIGRALASAGFGTLFALEFDEGTSRIADAPVAAKGRPTPAEPAICTLCNDASKPVAPGRMAYCNQKGVPLTHLDCAKG